MSSRNGPVGTAPTGLSDAELDRLAQLILESQRDCENRALSHLLGTCTRTLRQTPELRSNLNAWLPALEAAAPEVRRQCRALLDGIAAEFLTEDDVLRSACVELALRYPAPPADVLADATALLLRLARESIAAVRANMRLDEESEGSGGEGLSSADWPLELVSDLLIQLPESYRLAVQTLVLDRLPLAEAAARLGRRPGALLIARERGLARLRDITAPQRRCLEPS